FFALYFFQRGSEAAVRGDELQFCRRRLATEHGVAMGKATEAIDDVLVAMRILEIVGKPELREQLDRAHLHRAIFAVLERHVEEQTLLLRELQIEARGNRMLRDRQCQRVGRERARGAAKHVARKLVEHDHGGDALERCRELLRTDLRELLVPTAEALANRRIDGVVLAKPRLGRQFLEPIAANLRGPVALHASLPSLTAT